GSEGPRPHRGFGAVEQVEESPGRSGGRLEHFEIPKGDLVHDQGASLAQAAELANLREVRFLERLEIAEERAAGAKALARRFQAERVEAQHLELPLDRLAAAPRVEACPLPSGHRNVVR